MLLWVVSVAGVVALQSRVWDLSGGISVPDVQPFYGPTELYTMLEHYGEAGRKAFLDFTLYDIYYPFVAYGAACLALVSLTRSTTCSHPRLIWVLVVPIAGLLVELLEQACFLGVLAGFPTRMPYLAFAASVLTVLKFALILVLLSCLAAFSFWRVILLTRSPRRCS